jgi:two-component system OmpR family response regulator
MKVLVVEDDKKVGAFLQRAMTEDGFVVDRVRTTAEAREQAAYIPYDLVVLDWMLPDGDGLSLCKQLRAGGLTTPILMLTARSEVGEKVLALNQGVDDFLTKPFALEELIARARALVRRASSGGKMMLSVGELTLDFRTRIVNVAGQIVDLTAKEFLLLEILVRNAPRVVTRSELLANVWHSSADLGSNVIEVHIKHLREKLNGAHLPAGVAPLGERIETVRAQGYRYALESGARDE